MNIVTVTVSGDVGTGKSAICGEIEILCKALRTPVEWKGGCAEKGLTHADWTDALEMYSPHVEIVEVNTNQLRRLTESHTALLAALEDLVARRMPVGDDAPTIEALAAIKNAKELG